MRSTATMQQAVELILANAPAGATAPFILAIHAAGSAADALAFARYIERIHLRDDYALAAALLDAVKSVRPLARDEDRRLLDRVAIAVTHMVELQRSINQFAEARFREALSPAPQQLFLN